MSDPVNRPSSRPIRRTDSDQLLMVRHLFTTVTRRYDFLNHLLSLRRDVAWRKETASGMHFFKTHRLLDVATGTCDLAIEAALKHPRIQVVAADLVPEMMARGRTKIERRGLSSRIRLIEGDALSLPFGDGQFDVAAVAFGIRNMPDRGAALMEMTRVVVPGGLVMILEMSLPRSPVLRPLYALYLNRILPRVARWFSSNPGAYRYLADTIMNFPSPEVLAGLMQRAGLERLEIHPLTCGITYLHVGYKPRAHA